MTGPAGPADRARFERLADQQLARLGQSLHVLGLTGAGLASVEYHECLIADPTRCATCATAPFLRAPFARLTLTGGRAVYVTRGGMVLPPTPREDTTR
jgi:hypothetical protein